MTVIPKWCHVNITVEEPTGAKKISLHLSAVLPHLIATISSQVIG